SADASPLIAGDRVYCGVAKDDSFKPHGIVYCLDRATGEKVWEFSDGKKMKQCFSSPVLLRGKLYIGEGLHQDSNCKVYCLDAARGKVIWRAPTNLPVWGPPSVYGGLVYFGLGNGNFIDSDPKPAGALLCLRADDGEEAWRHDVGDGVLGRPVVDARR